MSSRGLELVLPARAENVAVVRHALAGLAIDASLERLADDIRVERGGGGEYLVFEIRQPG